MLSLKSHRTSLIDRLSVFGKAIFLYCTFGQILPDMFSEMRLLHGWMLRFSILISGSLGWSAVLLAEEPEAIAFLAQPISKTVLAGEEIGLTPGNGTIES